VQRKCDVVRSLTTHGNENTAGRFKLIDVQDDLKVDILEIKSVCLVVISAYSFRIILGEKLAMVRVC